MSDESTPTLSLSEFLTEHSQQFSVSGLFGAIIVYITRFQYTLPVRTEWANLGIFSAIVLFGASTLVIFWELLQLYREQPSTTSEDDCDACLSYTIVRSDSSPKP